MIDTVIVWFPISPSPNQLKEWVSHPTIFPNGHIRSKYYQNAKMNKKAIIKCVYYPPNLPRYPIPHLRIQVSLPNCLFGNNVQMVTNTEEIVEVIEFINDYITDCSWLPEFDFGSGILWQVDAAYNHQVGEYVQDYVRALFKLDYPMRKTHPYPHEGVQFKSNVAITKFYDKYQESSSPSAYGILRQETTLRHTYYIKRRMNFPYPTLRDITFPWLIHMLDDDLERLHLKESVITDCSTARTVLESKYGWSKGGRLYAYLYARQSKTKERMIANGISERTIRNYENQITNAGLSLAMTDDCLRLSPLNIQTEFGTNVPVSLSDT